MPTLVHHDIHHNSTALATDVKYGPRYYSVIRSWKHTHKTTTHLENSIIFQCLESYYIRKCIFLHILPNNQFNTLVRWNLNLHRRKHQRFVHTLGVGDTCIPVSHPVPVIQRDTECHSDYFPWFTVSLCLTMNTLCGKHQTHVHIVQTPVLVPHGKLSCKNPVRLYDTYETSIKSVHTGLSDIVTLLQMIFT